MTGSNGPAPLDVLFLPGASGRGEFWEPVRAALARHGVTTTRSLDLPGLGGVAPAAGVGGFDDLVDHVAGHLRGPSALVGQSLGGYLATQVALRHPELVSHLVLAVTSAGFDTAAVGADDWRPAVRAADPHAPDWIFDRRPDLSERLADIGAPTLLVWADADPISPLAVGRHLASRLPRATLAVYRSDDHWVARHEAVDVARRIAGLLRFRLAGPDDADALTSIERDANLAALGHVFPPDRFPYPTDDVRGRWRATLADPAVTVVLDAWVDAFVAFDRDVLRHLAVHPDAWGTGAARAAVEYAVDRMGPRPTLWCLADNHRARGLYEHLGWVPTGRTRRAEWPPHPGEIEYTRGPGGSAAER